MIIKLLKFIVFFMGILIVCGIIILGFSIYIKFNSLSKTNNTKNLIMKIPENMSFLDYKVFEENIYISYKSINKVLIKVYNLKSGKTIKEIEILK